MVLLMSPCLLSYDMSGLKYKELERPETSLILGLMTCKNLVMNYKIWEDKLKF